MKILTILPLVLASLATYNTSAQTTVFVDFGGNGSPTTGNWNNITHGSTGQTTFNDQEIEDLIDSSGSETGISLLASTPNSIGYNTDGTSLTYTTSYPLTANQDFLYFDGGDVLTVTLSNLNQSLTYDLTFFSSRNASGSRITKFDLTAGSLDGSSTLLLESVDNTGDTITFASITPDVNDQIIYTVQRNTSGASFGYLNVMELTVIPEPSAYAIISGLLGLTYVMLRRRRA